MHRKTINFTIKICFRVAICFVISNALFFFFPRYIILSILLITVGCLVAGIGDLDFDQHSYIMGMLCVFAQGGYLTLVQKSSEGKRSTLEMVHINSYNTLPFFIVMSLFFREPALISESQAINGELLP